MNIDIVPFKNCSCLNCLCVPVCRHKEYQNLLNCNFIMDYLYLNNEDYSKRLHIVCEALYVKPVYVEWEPHAIISQNKTFGYKGSP